MAVQKSQRSLRIKKNRKINFIFNIKNKTKINSSVVKQYSIKIILS